MTDSPYDVAPPEAGPDAAWVRIPVPQSPVDLVALLEPETLFRLNPLLEIKCWGSLGEGCFAVEMINHGNGKTLTTELRVARREDGLHITYLDGLKASTSLRVETDTHGQTLLWLIDRYDRCPAEERERRLDEADTTITAWGTALQRHFTAWRRWSRYPLWRWYIRRIHLPMTPASRRIVRLIFWTSLVELAVFLLLVAVLFGASLRLTPSGLSR